MPGNFKKDDLRIIRTLKSLSDSLEKLLNCRNFNRLTVNDLCEEAQISRPTFYAHFDDKYDMLKYWLDLEVVKILQTSKTLEDVERNISAFIFGHTRLLTNLVEDANHETTELLCSVMVLLLDINNKPGTSELLEPQHTALSVFCAGGMINFLSWQVKSKFPLESQAMIAYLFRLITHLLRQENQLKPHWERVSWS